VGLALAVVAAHAPVVHVHAIALDDPLFLVQNRLVLHPSVESARRFFGEVLEPSTVSAYYLPLSMTSLMLDVAAGGSPTHLEPFHVTSLALHVLATLLLFLLLRRLCGCAVPAALAALWFGVHPLMVEPIASAGERKTVLATALAFASLWGYVRFAQDRARGWRVASVALFALALLAKPSVLALPLVLLVLDVWPLRRYSRVAWLEKWPYLVLAAASAIVTVLAVQRTWEFGDPPPLDLPVLALKACWLLGFYMGKVVWPVELSTVYATPAPFTLLNPAVLAGVACGVALTCGAVFACRRAPALLAGWSVFVLLLAPTFGILRFSAVIAYDRYVQLPAFGLALVLAAGLAALWRSPRAAEPAARAALVLVGLLLALAESAGTRATIAHWRDSLTLWRHAVRVSPAVPDSHNGLGATYSDLHQSPAAIAEFRRAIAVEPGYVDAHQNLGRELLLLGRVEEALPELGFAATHAPRSPAAALELGLGLEAAGRLHDAELQFRRALALRPGYLPALSPLGSVLVMEGRSDEGLAILRRELARSPDDARAGTVLAVALAQVSGPSDEVVRLLNDALARDPRSAAALNELAWLRATAADPAFRDTAEALRLSERALALASRPDANALDTRAAALAAAGRYDEAVTTAERAVALARAANDSTLATSAAGRLAGYRRGRNFVQERAPIH
jgi:tetratricopeptide (TPR) repeat protein